MAWVVLDGLGTIRVKDMKIVPGAQEITDRGVLEILEGMNLTGLEIHETRESVQPEPPEPSQAAEEDHLENPYEKFQGRDGLWYFLKPAGPESPFEQSEGFESEEEVDTAIQEAQEEAGKFTRTEDLDQSPESGTLQPSELMDTEFPCRAEGCDRIFRSTGARRNHERIKHAGLAQQSQDE